MTRPRRGGRASDEVRRPLEGVFPSKLTQTKWEQVNKMSRIGFDHIFGATRLVIFTIEFDRMCPISMNVYSQGGST